jgi:site-specific recombinase XerD
MRKRLSHAYESPEHNFAKEEIFKAIRIKTHGMGPHALCHTFAILLLKPGENLRVIESLMNHKSLATTARYLHSRSQELVKFVNGLKLLAARMTHP